METKIIKINPKELKLLKHNARFMTNDEFRRLVENVKRDGELTSVPFCAKDKDGDWEVLSGNHRVQAAIEAGLEEISVMVTEKELTKDQKIGIQLSHNSITGKDDMAILKELYDLIEDVDYKAYSGLDDETLKKLEKIQTQSIGSSGLEFQIIQIAFLPSEISEIKKVMEDVRKELTNNPTIMARFTDYDNYMETMTEISKSYMVKNSATVFMTMLGIVNNHIEEAKEYWLENGDDKSYVPLSTIIGRKDMKTNDARILDRAVQKLISSGEVDKMEKEKALSVLAEKYLGEKSKPKEDKKKEKKQDKGKENPKTKNEKDLKVPTNKSKASKIKSRQKVEVVAEDDDDWDD